MLSLTRLISITAITGHAPAGGAVLSITSDYRFATGGNFKIGLNEVQVGIVVPPVILTLLNDVVGPRNAQYLGLTGKLLSPEEALSFGLVDEIVSAQDLIPRSCQFLSQWLHSTTNGAVKGTKELLREHIKDAFVKCKKTQTNEWLDQWFSNETQEKRNQFNLNLAKKKQTQE